MDAVQISDVTKTFGAVTAVKDLCLNIPEGSIYGFTGPNGSGKTTTMRMIVNIFYPDRGTIRVLGLEASAVRSGLIGYLPEERGLYRQMAVQPLLEFHAELRGGRPMTAEITHWLEKFGLSDCASRKLDTLSKGMSQKIQFIAAVVPEPKVLILDEPFTGLDPVSADVIRTAILELRRRGATVILSSHDMSVAENMCDYIFMIYRGNKVLDGTLASIQDRYGNDTIRVSTEGGSRYVEDLPGVEKIRDLGQLQELRMTPGCDPQAVLRVLLSRTPVTSFSIMKPSLHDIFVRIAGPVADEGAEGRESGEAPA
jgi:ABC-2 type transport system ATP-binding protein